MNRLSVIVLAAGLGTRMKSSLAKVLHPVAGRPMVLNVIENILSLEPDNVVAVVGHQAEKVRALLPDGVESAVQEEQLGTAHAAMTGLSGISDAEGTLLLVSGDTPLIDSGTFRRLIELHEDRGAGVTILTARLADPTGYGRIIRDTSGNVSRIVEQKDASEDERAVDEINAGTYCFNIATLRSALSEVRSENAQREFYLTDVAAIVSGRGGKVLGMVHDSAEDVLGINSRNDLAKAEKILRGRINSALMTSGVTLTDPDTTYISPEVKIGRDTVVHHGNYIHGRTIIGEGCTLMPGNIIENCSVADGVTIKGYSVLTSSEIGEGASVGPFAHVRPGSLIGKRAKVGNFVELKKAILGEGAKASHLSYLGDADIGADVNIGAGTITCNYDGYSKYRTVIEDGVFVGSDSQFVAPVRVGKNAVIAAGTTVTEDVPEDSLALARTPQTNREGWAKRRKLKHSKRQAD